MLSRITIPSGRCPYQLNGTDKDSVIDCVGKVKDSAPPGVTYRASALRYWIRHTYDINGYDYKIAVNMFDSLFDDDN
jgi:hypothetical protein